MTNNYKYIPTRRLIAPIGRKPHPQFRKREKNNIFFRNHFEM